MSARELLRWALALSKRRGDTKVANEIRGTLRHMSLEEMKRPVAPEKRPAL